MANDTQTTPKPVGPPPDEKERPPRTNGMDRRAFVRTGAGVITASATGLVVGCSFDDASKEPDETARIEPESHSMVPETPAHVPEPVALQTFTRHEAATVDMLTAHILPGSPDDPGAREAGVVTYIDLMLATNEGFAEETYRAGPFAQVDGGDDHPVGSPQATPGASPVASPMASPAASPLAQEYDAVIVPVDLIGRYGYQSVLSPRETYRAGIDALDRYCQREYGHDFVDLGHDQREQVIGDMARDAIGNFDARMSAQSFFQVLRRHTAEGMFSDPVYGGNRNMVGWKLVGYLGAQRAYQPAEFAREGTSRQPQSIADMAAFHAGEPEDDTDNVILPVSGSGEKPDPRHQHEPAGS